MGRRWRVPGSTGPSSWAPPRRGSSARCCDSPPATGPARSATSPSTPPRRRRPLTSTKHAACGRGSCRRHTWIRPRPRRARLAEDRPEAALVALGGRCEAGRPAGLLLAIAQVREYSGDLSEALACYRAARAADPGSAEAAERFARAAARAPAADVEPYAEQLRAAAASGTAAAEWALARLDLAHGRSDEALARLEGFLRAAAPDEPGLGAARATRDRLLRASDDAARTRWHRRAALAGAAALVLFAAAIAWVRGSTVSRALARRPRLYPAVARTVAALRHDVLKHRASVLSAALDPGAREEVARALLQPEPVSRTVAQAYQRLRQEARAQGVSLRPLAREPVFGPL